MIRFVKSLIVIAAFFSLFLVIADYIRDYRRAYEHELTNTATVQGETVVVEIPAGASLKEIAAILKREGLIEFEGAFVQRAQDSGYRGKLQSGTYELNTGMNTLDMMEAMSPVYTGPEIVDKLVVPEGFTIDQIAARCESQGICTEEEFIRAVESVTTSDFPYLADVPAGANVRYRLEGYLFPATYDIYESTTAESLVDWMLDTFENRYTDEIKARAEELGYNSYDLITRASIVERECKVSEERAMVAGVINNRLEDGMLLQVCPSVLYPLTEGMYNKDTVTYAETELDSPYNTYKYSGLPVGPICNPGTDCIEAVLYPAEHTYFFYHVDNAELGTHVFTETYEEHIETQIVDE